VGMAIGPLYAGYMADRTGSYVSAFTTLAITALFGAVFFLLATKPVKQLQPESAQSPTQ